jgi:magnesium transporter
MSVNENENKPLEPEENETLGLEDTNEQVDVKTVTTEELAKAIESKDKAALGKIFQEVNDIDIAEAADELDLRDLIVLFRDVRSELTAPLFDSLSQDTKEKLVKAMTDKELVGLVNKQAADDIADTVGDMPANLAKRVIHAADKDMREDINQLLKYKPDSAGAIMTTEYLEFKENLSVEDTIEQVRKIGKEAETVYTIFVRNGKRKFVGTVDLDDLIFAKKDLKLADIMNRDAPSCHVNTDKEEVANTIQRYDLNALAVLNDDECLTGIVTVDDAVDVITDEANEDIEKMSAVSTLDDSYLETHPLQMAKKCVPWIIVLLVLGTFSSMVLSIFQEKLTVLPVLAAFIPVLMDTGGNAGGQTIALMIRGLALKEFDPKDFWKILGREVVSAIIIAAGISAFAFIWFTMEQYTGIVHNTQADVMYRLEMGLAADPEAFGTIWNGQCWSSGFAIQVFKVSAIVAGTLFITTIVSKIIAVTLPLLAAKFHKDPAIVSQPLLTTIVDVTSLLIYFGIAEVLVLQFL